MEVTNKIEEVFRVKRKVFIKQAYGITKHHQDAEDVVQQAFLKALGYRETFNSESDVACWMMSIVSREALNMLSSNRHQGMSREIEESDSYSNEEEDFNSRLREEVSKMIASINNTSKRNICFSYFVCGNTPKFIKGELGIDIERVKNVVKSFKADLAVKYKA